MAGIFDHKHDRDIYLDHMKRTMDWIEDKMRQAAEDAANNPTLRKQGYDVGIYVEGRWLLQLIAENVMHYESTQAMMRRLAELIAHPTQRIRVPESVAENLPEPL